MTVLIEPALAESERRVLLELQLHETAQLAEAIKTCHVPSGFQVKVVLVLEPLPEGERREHLD